MKGKKFIAVVLVAMITVSAFAASLSYDKFIERAGDDISNAASGLTVSVLPFDCDNQRLGNAISDDVESHLGKEGVSLVDRKNLDETMKELEFQASGMVDDDLAVSIGHMAGAELLVMGEARNMVDHYQVKLRLVDVEAGTVAYQNTFSVKYDRALENILEDNGTTRGRKEFGFGVRGGAFIGLTKGHEDMTDIGKDVRDITEIGYPVSISFNWNPVNYFSLQTELNVMINNGLSIKGTHIVEDNPGPGEQIGDIQPIEMDMDYSSLDIPLILAFDAIYSPVKVSLYAGGYASIPISTFSTVGLAGRIPVDEATDITNFTYGVLGGLGVEIPLGPGGIAIDARYIHDLNPLKIKMYDNVTGQMAEYGALYRRGVVVSAGYTFHL